MTCTWHRNPNEPKENEFYSTLGVPLGHIIPSDLGGVYLFIDGPISTAGYYMGHLFVTWDVTFKGLRSSDTVVTARRRVCFDEESDEEVDSVVYLDGKQYVRVGEAKNPGPW
jgi:hypothetical protein